MNLSVLRSDDPVQRIFEHLVHLDGSENFFHPRLVLLADEVLRSLRQGVLYFDGLPFLIMGGKDGRDVLTALEALFQRWDIHGQPPALSLIDQTLEQLGISQHHPYRKLSVALSRLVQARPHAVRRGLFAVIMAKMLTEHGDYKLSGEGHARLFLATLLHEEPYQELGDLVHSEDFAKVPLGDGAIAGDGLAQLCRQVEDGNLDVQQVPMTGDTGDLEEIVMLSALAEDARTLYALLTSYVANPKLLTMAASFFAPACLWSDNDNDIHEGRKSA